MLFPKGMVDFPIDRIKLIFIARKVIYPFIFIFFKNDSLRLLSLYGKLGKR
jgi:hypothetical protein